MQFRVSALKNLWTVCCSVAKLCPFLCDPMDCGMSGFPLLHYLPEFAQTHILNFEYTLELHHFSSVAQSCPTICDPMDCSIPGFSAHHQLLELAQTHVIQSVMPANHFIHCCSLLLLPSIFPSISVFSNESFLPVGWPKNWSFSFSISLQMNIQDWSPLGWTGLISLKTKGLSRVFFTGVHGSLSILVSSVCMPSSGIAGS